MYFDNYTNDSLGQILPFLSVSVKMVSVCLEEGSTLRYITHGIMEGNGLRTALRSMLLPCTSCSILEIWYIFVSHQHDRLPGDTIRQPHVVSTGEKRVDLLSITPERSLVHNYWNGTSWSGYKKVARVCKFIDKVVASGQNRIDVFYRGVDHSSYHRWYDGTSWLPDSDAGEKLGEPSDSSAAYIIPVTGVVDTDPTTKVQPRLEINDLHARHKVQFDLYLRALARLQAKPEFDSMSFYGISSMFYSFSFTLGYTANVESHSWGSIYSMAV